MSTTTTTCATCGHSQRVVHCDRVGCDSQTSTNERHGWHAIIQHDARESKDLCPTCGDEAVTVAKAP
jgi:predicted RNA-binding Zn-ribbon protein involved in translation (DUF1610 family)